MVRGLPMPGLGVVRLFEAIALVMLVADVVREGSSHWIARAVAAAVVGPPYGYVVEMVIGTTVARAARLGWGRTPQDGSGSVPVDEWIVTTVGPGGRLAASRLGDRQRLP